MSSSQRLTPQPFFKKKKSMFSNHMKPIQLILPVSFRDANTRRSQEEALSRRFGSGAASLSSRGCFFDIVWNHASFLVDFQNAFEIF
jgi:hypothetical protein